jgi:hypothetical protein
MKSLEDCMREQLHFKRELIAKISVQMEDDVKAGVLSDETVALNKMALDNMDAAAIWLEKNDYEQAMHFYSRGCSNMGEFKGRSDKERKTA